MTPKAKVTPQIETFRPVSNPRQERRAAAAAKKAEKAEIVDRLVGVGIKARPFFAREAKVLAAVASRLPKLVGYGAIGAGAAAAYFTHSQWLPHVAQFLHTPGGYATLGVLAGLAVGAAAVYLARKTKPSISQWMGRHLGRPQASEAAPAAARDARPSSPKAVEVAARGATVAPAPLVRSRSSVSEASVVSTPGAAVSPRREVPLARAESAASALSTGARHDALIDSLMLA